MLTDQEILGVADDHVQAQFDHRVEYRPDNVVGIEAVKVCDLDDPSGTFFKERFVGPDNQEIQMLGPGGFFVHRADGRIESFGSGQLFEAWRAHLDAFERLQVTPDVVRYLLNWKRNHRR